MPRIHLIASSDDYLLEQRLSAAVAEACDSFGGIEAEIQPEEATPESVSLELVSPSLFAAQRVLVVPDAREWLGAAAPPGHKAGRTQPPDPEPLIHVLGEGVPEGVVLIMGAWCGRKPTGSLVKAFDGAGQVDWVGLPPPPKPWEDAVLSDEQRRVLDGVLDRAVEGVSFSAGARRLLLDRLGFSPRLLVTEARKLAGATGGEEVDVDLVRQLTFPRERSLEVVRDAVLGRRLEPLLDLVAAAGAGAPINNWQGQRLEAGGFVKILYSMVANLQLQLLYLRRVTEAAGLCREMAPEKTSDRGWYGRKFKGGIAPKLLTRLKEDAPSPLLRPGGKAPSPWTLGLLFSGAGRYSDLELEAAVAGAAEVEVQVRRDAHALEALTAWLAGFIGSCSG
jgi:hypothetical protein